MIDPQSIPKALKIATTIAPKLKGAKLTHCESTIAKRDAVLAFEGKASNPEGSEVYMLELDIDGKIVMLAAAGPVGTKAALGI